MPRLNVRYVTFSPAEMAYEAPEDVSDPKRFPTIARGRAQWMALRSFKRGYVRLAPDVRKMFKDEESVNAALRRMMETQPMRSSKRKKSA